MKGGLLMSQRERERMRELFRVKEGKLLIKNAAEILSISYRQCRRVYRRYYLEGDIGLVHRSRGMSSNRSKDPCVKKAILERYKERYPDFGPTLAVEKLEQDGYKLDHETLRLWLIEEGLWQRRRQRKKHRRWRERKAHFGEMVQMDGSHHPWFEDRGNKCCFMNMVDDATGITFGMFGEEETTKLAMLTLWSWIERYGIPSSLYVDRKNVFVTDREPTLEEQLKGEEPLTQFGKACQKLGIKIIKAYSPQAKGRVERNNGVYQDRLVKELRLSGINQINEANKFLKKGFINNLNKKFSVKPRNDADFHHSVDPEISLRKIFCFEEQRKVNNDWTVCYHNRLFQIKKQNDSLPPAKDKVTVCEWLDGSIHILYREQQMNFKEIPCLTQKQEPGVANKRNFRKKYVPRADHPWRKPFLGQKRLSQTKNSLSHSGTGNIGGGL